MCWKRLFSEPRQIYTTRRPTCADRWQITCAANVLCMTQSVLLWLHVSARVSSPLTSIVFIKGVHAGEVDGEGLEGRRQADAALRSFHVEARRRARVGRLGQARLGILHAEYGSRRLGWLSAAPHGRSTSPRKEESSKNPNALAPNAVGAKTYSQQAAAEVREDFDVVALLLGVSDKTKAPLVQNHPREVRRLSAGCPLLIRSSVLINDIFVFFVVF